MTTNEYRFLLESVLKLNMMMFHNCVNILKTVELYSLNG